MAVSVIDVCIPDAPTQRKRAKRTITIDAGLVDALRKVARADGKRLGELLELALRAYLSQQHPDWSVR